jgi:hypothetical protein
VQVEAVGRAERRALHQQAVEDHRERERQHGEEDVAVAREEQAERERHHRAGRDARADHHEAVEDARARAEQRRGVRAEAEVEPLSERHEPGAHQQHQPEHHQALGEREREQEHEPLRRDRRGREEARADDRERDRRPVAAHILRASGAAKSPFGRAISTSAITR